MAWTRTVPLALLGAVLVSACAANERSGVAPAAPDKTRAPATDATPPAPRAEPDDGERESPRAALAHAKIDLDHAERELLTSAGDCAAACRALASMERATGHLCALAGADDDHARCDEARTKVLSARERVRSTCGVCEGGPSLDRTAPIPSVGP